MYQLRVQVQTTLAEDPGTKGLQGLGLEGPRPQDVLLGHSVSLKIYMFIYMYVCICDTCEIYTYLHALHRYTYIHYIYTGIHIYISGQFSRSVVSDSLQPHEPQHARPPCPSPTPGAYPNPCPLSQ